MLRFQDDYTIFIATFEKFILLVYTMIDDLYKSYPSLLCGEGYPVPESYR